jgi:hypothetical protein
MIASAQCDIVAPDRGMIVIGHGLKQSGRSASAAPEQNTTGVAPTAIETG